MSFGLELVQANSRVKSSVPNPFIPGATISGSTKGEAGVVPVPSMGLVWSKNRQSPFTFGLGMGAVGGAASLYPHTPLMVGNYPNLSLNPKANPVLLDHGRSASVIVLQVTPTVSAQLTKKLSVGVAPIIDLASLNVNPMSLGRPINDPLMTYGTRYVWGGGFQIGTLYDFQNHFKAGFMFKSPIWAEKLYFTGTYYDAQNNPIADASTFQLNLPMTLSAGVSYDGFRDTVVGMDFRYLDYANCSGLNAGVNSQGIVEGLDWESVFAITLGAERKINDRIKARVGYAWNENPIPGRSAALCISAPMITQHVFSCGLSYALAKDLEVAAAYSHAFEASHTGTILGQPGTSVSNILSANSFFANITKKW
jgi:long-chain fatty acid transport protein